MIRFFVCFEFVGRFFHPANNRTTSGNPMLDKSGLGFHRFFVVHRPDNRPPSLSLPGLFACGLLLAMLAQSGSSFASGYPVPPELSRWGFATGPFESSDQALADETCQSVGPYPGEFTFDSFRSVQYWCGTPDESYKSIRCVRKSDGALADVTGISSARPTARSAVFTTLINAGHAR